jgi:hypothetical protein
MIDEELKLEEIEASVYPMTPRTRRFHIDAKLLGSTKGGPSMSLTSMSLYSRSCVSDGRDEDVCRSVSLQHASYDSTLSPPADQVLPGGPCSSPLIGNPLSGIPVAAGTSRNRCQQ